MERMKSRYLMLGILALLVFGIVLISGCTEKECKINDDCLAKTCFTGKCKENKCVLSSVSDCCGNEKCESTESYETCADDCPNCDDANKCTKDSYDYHQQKCVNIVIPNQICCGNKICETGEDYTNCAADCPNCNDNNDCTKDSYDYHKQKCINEVIIPCCGNEICDEDAETLSNCPEDCPNCDDDNKFTEESFNYTTQKCDYIRYSFFDDFEEGDLSGWDIYESSQSGWEVISENDNKVVRMYGDTDMNSGSDSWTDYTFIGKFKLIEGGGPCIWVREDSGRYQFESHEKNEVVFKIVEYDITDTIEITRKSLSVPLNEWHDFKIVVKGSNLKFYFNDNLIIDADDEKNTWSKGRIGVGSCNSEVYFDDFKVRES